LCDLCIRLPSGVPEQEIRDRVGSGYRIVESSSCVWPCLALGQSRKFCVFNRGTQRTRSVI
jgi:hypothetical protein